MSVLNRTRSSSATSLLALLVLLACSKPASKPAPLPAPGLRYDPAVGELVVAMPSAAKPDPQAKKEWLALAATALDVAKGKIDSAKARVSKDRLADLAENVGDAVGVGEEMRKLVELTDQQFIDLGRRCARELDSKNKCIALPDRRAARLSALVSPHAEEDGIHVSVKLYDSPLVNAFALPDGSIRVFSGLLDIASDDELRAVLGHEIGHVVQNHAKSATRVAMLASAGAKAALTAANGDSHKLESLEAVAAHIAQALVGATFSRSQERQADDYAFAFVMAHEYSPDGLVSLFAKLGNERKGSAFASHPPSGLRADRMRDLIDKATHK